MRAVVLCALLGACSFRGAGGGTPGDDGGGDDDDPPMVDAAVGAPACTDGDADNDTVCNAADRCAGQDDRLDGDGDLIPNGCDDWPCGGKPSSPSDRVIVAFPLTRQWTAEGIDIGNGQLVVAQRDAMVPYELDYYMRIDCGTDPTCQAQVELGLSVIGKLGCVVDRVVADGQIEMGRNVTGMFKAPLLPGAYDIRLNGARQATCATSSSWFGGEPGGGSTIAKLCVP